MGVAITVTSWKYNSISRHLHIFYDNGSAELYYSVPKFIYANLLRRTDKAAFVHKYLEHFKRLLTFLTHLYL